MPPQPLLVLAASGDEISRWSTRRRMWSAAPSRWAAGRLSIPSFSAAPAMLTASIESDLPRSREERRAPAMYFGGTRTTRSPRAIRNRSNAPDTCRQSSIAHTRSGSSALAHRSSRPKPAWRAGTVSSSTAAAASAWTAPQVWVFMWLSVPITIMRVVPSIVLTKRTAGGHISLGADATIAPSPPLLQPPHEQAGESARARPRLSWAHDARPTCALVATGARRGLVLPRDLGSGGIRP